jgi:hypothetical protein
MEVPPRTAKKLIACRKNRDGSIPLGKIFPLTPGKNDPPVPDANGAKHSPGTFKADVQLQIDDLLDPPDWYSDNLKCGKRSRFGTYIDVYRRLVPSSTDKEIVSSDIYG